MIAVRLPRPGPRRPQGRVRAAVPGARGRAVRGSAPACPARINPLDLGPLGHGWDRLDAAEAQRRGGDHLRPLAHPDPRPGRLPAHRRAPVPFGPAEETRRRRRRCARSPATPPAATRLRRDHHPAAVAGPRPPPDELVDDCRYATGGTSSTTPGCCATPSAQLVTGTLAGLFDAPTTIDVDWPAPIQSLSLSRLDAARRPGRRHRADLPQLLGPRPCARSPRPATCGSWSATSPGSRSASARGGQEPRRRPAAVPRATATSSSPSPTSPPTCSPPATPAPRPSHRQGPAAPGRHQDPARPGPGRRRRARHLLGLTPIAQRPGHRLGDGRQGPRPVVVGDRTVTRSRPSCTRLERALTYTNDALAGIGRPPVRQRRARRSVTRRTVGRPPLQSLRRRRALTLRLFLVGVPAARRRRSRRPRRACGPGGTAQTVSDQHLDAVQMANAATIVHVVAAAGLPQRAPRSRWPPPTRRPSSSTTCTPPTRTTSIGLFAQMTVYYGADVAADPAKSHRRVPGPAGPATELADPAADRRRRRRAEALRALPAGCTPWEPLATPLTAPAVDRLHRGRGTYARREPLRRPPARPASASPGAVPRGRRRRHPRPRPGQPGPPDRTG